jgi:ABC-type antimicrobial peptide transport system permease subunit
MLKLIRIAGKDVYRKIYKTIVFSLIMATCISAMTLAFGMNMSVNSAIESNITNSLASRKIHIGINNSEGRSFEEYLSYLRTFPHIEEVYRYMPNILAVVERDSNLSKGGYLLSSSSQLDLPKTVKGNGFADEENNVAIVPRKIYIQQYSGKTGQIIEGSTLIGKTMELIYRKQDGSSKFKYVCKVVGVYPNQPGDFVNKIYIPLNDMIQICNNIGYSDSLENLLFTAIVSEQQFVEDTIKQLSSINNISAQLQDKIDEGEIGIYKLVSRITGYMVYSIFIFLLLLLYLCVTNIAISNKSQVALYKAIGYNNGHIFYIVFSEAIIISLIGYLGGILIALLANTFLVNPIIYSKTQLPLSVSLSLLACIKPLISIVPIVFAVSFISYFKVKNIYPALLLRQD